MRIEEIQDGLDNWQDYVSTLLEVAISQEKYLNYLNERLLTFEMNQQRMINLLKNNNHDWKFLLRNLKPMKEEHDGMQNYLSILSKRLTELEELNEKLVSSSKRKEKLTIK